MAKKWAADNQSAALTQWTQTIINFLHHKFSIRGETFFSYFYWFLVQIYGKNINIPNKKFL